MLMFYISLACENLCIATCNNLVNKTGLVNSEGLPSVADYVTE
jgi:hypothetical protein